MNGSLKYVWPEGRHNMHDNKTNQIPFSECFTLFIVNQLPLHLIIMNQLFPFFSKAIAGFYFWLVTQMCFHINKTEHAAINHHKLLKSVVSWITGTLGVL